MRARKEYCDKLGLTQQEIALILSVSRSTWSMYVLGRREIPSASFRLLQEMLTHVEKELDARADESSATPNWQSIENYIEKKYRKTTIEHLAVSLDQAAALKHERAKRCGLSREFLLQKQKMHPDQRFGEIASFLKSTHNKETKALFDQAFKQATLEFQRQWLEAQLKTNGSGNPKP